MIQAWQSRSIDSLCVRVTSGGTPSRSRPEYFGGAIPWVKTGELRDGLIWDSEETISAQGLEESSAKLLPPNTVLMAMYGATVGALGRLGVDAACNQASCAMIVNSEEADSRWLFYALLNDRDRIVSLATGAAQQNLSAASIKQFRYQTPPLPEQQAIAEVLGALDDKIAANVLLAMTAEELASLTYDAITEAWPRQAMSSVVTPILGGTPSRARSDYWLAGDRLWISARDVTSATNRVVLDTVEKITAHAATETKAAPLPAGSVILTARGTVGEVARLARDASFNQSCYGFRPDTIPASLLYFSMLRSAERAKAVAHGSVFDTITKATFDHLEVAWDPQRVASAEAELAPFLSMVTSLLEENRTLAATRDALLPQLMSGKLRVRDAETIVEVAT